MENLTFYCLFELCQFQQYNLRFKIFNFQILSLINYIGFMSFYRSQTVLHFNLILPRQNSWQIMNRIGLSELVHIVPIKSNILLKPFNPQVRRCQQVLQKIYNLQKSLKKKQHKTTFKRGMTKEQLSIFFNQFSDNAVQQLKNVCHSYLDKIDEQINQLWSGYTNLKKKQQSFKQKLQYYRENYAILKAASQHLGITNFKSNIKQGSMASNFNQGQSMSFKCGIINNSQQSRFSRTVFRITRGNSWIKYIPFSLLFQKVNKQEESKSVYFILSPVQRNSYFQKKISKLIQSYTLYGGHRQPYSLPSSSQQYSQIISAIQQQLSQFQHINSLLQSQEELFLQKLLGQNSQNQNVNPKRNGDVARFQILKFQLLKQLEIYTQLNEMQLYHNFLQADIFVRKSCIKEVQQILSNFQKQTKQPTGHLIVRQVNKQQVHSPSYFTRTTYTVSAQQIVQTYGVPSYKQANPSFFTTITFPFLFGVMFGDIGHGLILFLFGLFVIFKKKEVIKINSFFSMIVPHRYLITLMGFFATYCGFIYNDFLSINLNLFGSCYDLTTVKQGQAIPRFSLDCVYFFGLDPVWGIAQNNLNFTNSLKMKIAVIIGVLHMLLGVCIKGTNSIYFKRKIQFFFQFIPQLIFLTALFGYMDFLIIFKWNKDWGFDSVLAPSIITTMINLPLKLGQTENCCGAYPMWGESSQKTTQNSIQALLLVISMISVPVMLLVKPLHKIWSLKNYNNTLVRTRQNSIEQDFQQKIFSEKHEKELQMIVLGNSNKNQNQLGQSQKAFVEISQKQHDLKQIFVHQMIQTIEYVLGCISNTASYLRLWALSLAHSQLSEVFLNKTVQSPIISGYSGIALMILLFPMFAGATFGVLMCMDVMECFLHTLRLHWVEFQNKFYKGNGHLFVAFGFTNRINCQIEKQSQ